MVLLAGTGERGDQPPLGQLVDVVGHDLGQAVTVVLEPQGVAAPEAPGLELVFPVLNPPPALDPEELRRVWVLRKILNEMNSVEAMELLKSKIKSTTSNAEFLMALNPD